MHITFTLPEIIKVIPPERAKRLDRFLEYETISMSEIANRGIDFALDCLALYAPQYNSIIRMFAHDCLQLMRNNFIASHKGNFITPGYLEHSQMLSIFDVVSDVVYKHASGIVGDDALTETIKLVEVPDQSHRDFDILMAIGYTLKVNIANYIRHVCDHVERSATSEREESLYRASMLLALRRRF